jgi:hypothetical protein
VAFQTHKSIVIITTESLQLLFQASPLMKHFLEAKLDLSMLHVWGCTTYVLIQKDKRPLGSLESHMEKCIFTGYLQGFLAMLAHPSLP